jgi:hypothetical protein
MCFSPEASFGAGIVITVIGVASIKKVKEPNQLYFASIPLIFGVQQIIEGFLWLSLLYPAFEPFESVSTYSFLFVAQVIWPIWVPYSILKFESNPKLKTVLKILLAIGIVVSAYLAYCLFNFQVEGKIVGFHIDYIQNYPEALSRYGGALYLIATIFPSFISGMKKMWLLGTLILVSYIVSSMFFSNYVVSVWCFFAAVISIIVYLIVKQNNLEISKPKEE